MISPSARAPAPGSPDVHDGPPLDKRRDLVLLQPMPSKPGELNLITDVPGLRVGHAVDETARTGCTVILADRPAVCGCDVRGGGPGTRETDLLAADTLVEAVDAVVLSGGSVYGLAAADGVVSGLAEAGRGYRLGPGLPTAPIVPAAILFDLGNAGRKDWGEVSPYGALGREALRSAAREFEIGTVGAGYGAAAGALQGGVGSASLVDDAGLAVGALAAVNAFGSVVMPGTRAFWAWPFEEQDEFGGVRPGPDAAAGADDWGLAKADPAVRGSTTLVVVATSARLSPGAARRLAVMAQDGLARAVRPIHTPFDGDVVFALSTAEPDAPAPSAFDLAVLGERAAACVARAVARGVYAARGRPGGPPAYREAP